MLKKLIFGLALAQCLFGLEYEDYYGKHELKDFPKRVIYLTTQIEVPAMLGVWDKVIGISDYAFDDDIVQATADIKALQRFPTDHYAGIDVERLKKLGVDLVVTYPADLKSIEFAKKFGVNFLALQTTTIKDVFEHIQMQAKVFDKTQGLDVKLAKMQEVFDLIKERLKVVERKKVVELFQKFNHINGASGLDTDILAYGGVESIGSRYIEQPRGEINLEKIVAENPDVIFLWWLSPYSEEDVLNNPQLQTLKAVKNKQVFKLPAMEIAGPRTPLISLFIAMKSYPEAFGDVSWEAVLKDYYEVVFGLKEGLEANTKAK